MMRIFTVFVATAIISGLAVETASAQSKSNTLSPKSSATAEARTPLAKNTLTSKAPARKGLAHKPAPAVPGLKHGASGSRTGTTRRVPAPPVPHATRSMGRKSGSATPMFAGDPTGRRDLVGHSVGFYPTVRGLASPGHHQSAQKSAKAPSLKENGLKRKS
jgi:hypothetical protein